MRGAGARLPSGPSAKWGEGPSLDRLLSAPGGRVRAGAPGRLRAPPRGQPQPRRSPGDSPPHPPDGFGPGGSARARRAEAAASLARGGGRGGPGITWAEAGPGAPGGLSPESGRRQQERHRLLALPPSPAWAPSPTGERQPGERAHLRPSARPALPGAGPVPAPLSARDPGLVRGQAPCSLASAGAPRRAALSSARALLLQPSTRTVLCPRSEGGSRTGRAGPSGWAPPRGARSAESTDRLKGMALTVDVAGPAPWGFRITGGRDFHTPIMVTKVAERGKAKAADLRPGDIIVAINGESAEGMLHAEAQSKIRQSPSPLRLQLDRSQAASPGQTNGDSSLEVLATRFQGSVRTHTESQSSLRSSYSSPTSLSPRASSPFSPPPPSSPLTGEAAISHSFQSLVCSPGLPTADRLSYSNRPGSQQAGLSRAGDSAVLVLPPSPGPGPRSSRPSPSQGPSFLAASRSSVNSEGGSLLLDEDSEVFKMLQENREGRVAPRQSSSFRLLQEALEAEERGGTPAFLPSSLSPQSSLPTSRALAPPPKLHTCEKCSTSIANQAVRIQEGRYRHPGCYTCADCGLNLKMRGHFWVGDELYCEKHARQRYSAPTPLSSRA
ncbi:PDZ and LIM domain protein 2 isoform X1 [Cebus imitator]|uniref:PDZ and LIM domain protein 2 isoform X1 n=1 Tax=Cebus imitator TaxID=2715852 RepID=UPI00080A5D90|nr:PDZ and LIM domain protein 2 isoform X1 [Cebus imitator]